MAAAALRVHPDRVWKPESVRDGPLLPESVRDGPWQYDSASRRRLRESASSLPSPKKKRKIATCGRSRAARALRPRLAARVRRWTVAYDSASQPSATPRVRFTSIFGSHPNGFGRVFPVSRSVCVRVLCSCPGLGGGASVLALALWLGGLGSVFRSRVRFLVFFGISARKTPNLTSPRFVRESV